MVFPIYNYSPRLLNNYYYYPAFSYPARPISVTQPQIDIFCKRKKPEIIFKTTIVRDPSLSGSVWGSNIKDLKLEQGSYGDCQLLAGLFSMSSISVKFHASPCKIRSFRSKGLYARPTSCLIQRMVS